MKLVAQNYTALTYLSAFLPIAASKQFAAYLYGVHSAWQPGQKLSDDAFQLLLKMNTDLRRAYDALPARSAGMKSFDQEFMPLLGWEEYYSQNL